MWFFFFMILKNQDYKQGEIPIVYFNEGRKLGPLIIFNWQYFSIGNSYFEKKIHMPLLKNMTIFPAAIIALYFDHCLTITLSTQ